MRPRLASRARALLAVVVATGVIASGGVVAASSAQAEDLVVPSAAATAVSTDITTAAPMVDPTVTAAPAPTQGATPTAKSPGTISKALAYAKGQGVAGDLHGTLPSLYKGRWYTAYGERNRICIARRESHSNYRAVSGNGRYQGAYQMSRSLARGAAWMMLPEVRKEMGAEGERIVNALRRTSLRNWNRYWQDRAFFTIWRGGKGRAHWGGLCWKSPAQKRAEAKARAIAAKKAAAHRAAVKKAAAKKSAAKKAAAKKSAAKKAAAKKAAAKKSAAKKAAAKKAAAKKAAAQRAAARR